MRNLCEAFGYDAEFEIDSTDARTAVFRWKRAGKTAELKADFTDYSFKVEAQINDGFFRYCQE